jgi:penicillin-binding protein 1B
MVNLLQGVLRSGTGARVWSYGFNLPAAGKTGTSHDAWFAGFTTKLLCVVWVGLDDYQDLKVDGPRGALPVWAEFMKAAHKHRSYRDATDFAVPDGVVSAQVDVDSGMLATSACPKVTTNYYILGTQPVQFCPLHQGGSTEIASWGEAPGSASANPPNIAMQPGAAPPPPFSAVPPAQPYPNAPKQNQPKPAKHGFFDKFKNIFK